MGAVQMKEQELEAIGVYVKNHIADWIKESNIIPFSSGSRLNLSDRDFPLSERIIRVEEGIKHQGDLLEKMLDQMDKRFEQVDKRFEQVDKRFNELRIDMNSRFEQVDKRFSQLQWTMGIGFTVLAALMGIFNFY